MAVPGLSLFGFLSQRRALAHLRVSCELSYVRRVETSGGWAAARRMRGLTVERAGRPRRAPLAGVEAVATGAEVAMVEVGPLLATQVNVNLAHVHSQFADLSWPPTPAQLMELCLPPVAERPAHCSVSRLSGELVLRAGDPNVRIARGPRWDGDLFGVRLETASRHVQVVRYDGDYYLQNGYHRAIAAALAGATMIPSIVLDARSFEDLANMGLPRRAYTTGRPPTLAHFIRGSAYPVRLRTMSKVLRFGWSERLVALE